MIIYIGCHTAYIVLDSAYISIPDSLNNPSNVYMPVVLVLQEFACKNRV